ncbi:uncharacterized protein LODBEIA_P44390 [Lodderomyces beijingensis]|uniref:GRAM domain-containing protein n=1 Tax=Lodderomyces beijingensis TaxID=1775926 RepID=A0ABP0ZVA8_9ASCO
MSVNGAVLKPHYQKHLGTNNLPFDVSSDGLETLQYMSPTPRQSLTIKSNNSNNTSGTGGVGGNGSHTRISASDGYVYLTSKRFIFITATQGDIDSFVIDLTLAPLLQLTHKLQAPWFGSNYWQFILFSVPEPSIASDGLPKNEYFKGDLHFHDGGVFGFVEVLNRVLNDVVNNKDIDESLPAYSA